MEDRVFVGRKPELEALRAGLERAIAGRGGVFLVAGEPGIGKSELADRTAAEAEARGAEVIWGRAWEGEGAPPYWPWAQMLRSFAQQRPGTDAATIFGAAAAHVAQLVPEMRSHRTESPAPAPADSEEARFQLFDGITAFLKSAAETRPLLLVLDDLHWADQPSLLLLRFLAHEMADSHLLVIATYRDVEVSRGHPLAEVLPSLRRERTVTRFLLRGLPEDDVRAMLAALRGEKLPDVLARAISRETEGNPFFIQEIVRHLVEEGVLAEGGSAWTGGTPLEEIGLPESVRDVIGRRLSRLSKACTELLSVASVLGAEFALDALEPLAGLEREQLYAVLDEAVVARVVAEVPQTFGRYRFEHALIRESLYSELSTLARFRHHLRVAEVLEGLYARNPGPHLAELAHHFRQALPGGDVDRAIDYAKRAGDYASAQLAYEEAANHYERALQALELKPEPDERFRCELLLKHGEARWSAGLPEKTSLEEAADIAERLGDAEILARAALGRSGFATGIFVLAGEPIQLSLLERALVALGDGDSALRAQVMGRLSALRVFMGPHFGSSLAKAAVEMARRVGDKPGIAYVLGLTMWSACGPDDLEASRERIEEIIRLAGEIGDERLAAEGRIWKARYHFERGDLAAADREAAVLERYAASTRQALGRWLTAVMLGSRAMMEGRFEDAEAVLSAAMDRSLGHRHIVTAVGGILNLLHEQQGRVGQDLGDWEGSLAAHPRAFIWRIAVAIRRALVGRMEEARRDFESVAANDFADVPRDMMWMFTMSRLCELALWFGDVRRAALLYELLLPYRDRCIIIGDIAAGRGAVSGWLGRLATLLGRFDEAESHFERALEMNVKMRFVIFVAHTQYGYAEMLLARGASRDREKAAALSARALATAREIGMKPLEAKLVELRARAGFDEAPAVAPPAAPGAAFVRSGEFWTIRYEGTELRLKDAKGLRYVAELLRRAGRDIHATDLAAGGEDASREARADRGNAGEVLDAQARSEYRQRIEDLEGELEEATRWADAGRAAKIREEIDFLKDEISAAFGLGGRPRTTGSATERARKAVASRVQDAIAKIRKEHPGLAHHLDNSIRMGAFCSYAPERPVDWQL